MKKTLKKIFAGLIAFTLLVVFLPNFNYEKAEAVTQFPPASLLQPNDITTSHIRNGTIEPEDLDQTAGEYWDLKGDLNVGGAASTTGNVNVGGNLSITGSCVGCSGSNLTAQLTAAVNILKGQAVMIASSSAPVFTLMNPTGAGGEARYWGETSTQKLGQQINGTDVGVVEVVAWMMSKNNSPTDNIIVRLMNDDANKPGTTEYASSTILNANIPAACGLATTTLNVKTALSTSTKYWITLERSGAQHASNNFDMCDAQGDRYANGISAAFNGTAWNALEPRGFAWQFSHGYSGGALYPATGTSSPMTNSFIGFAAGNISASSTGSVTIAGIADGIYGVATGTLMYLNGSSGSLTTQAGGASRKVGIGIDGDSILIINAP